jgi:hypothetical protein
MNYQKIIRVNARCNKSAITAHLEYYYLNRQNSKSITRPFKRICLFCAATNNLTAEHILPRWVFGRDSNRFFRTTINGLSHKYNQTTIPACARCNNDLLSNVEKNVLQLFLSHQQHSNSFDHNGKADIIRWLELLDYKFQAFSLITKFRALKGKRDFDFLSDYPLSVLDPNIEYSPTRVLRNLREALNRITIKSKELQYNSLVTFKTKNSDMHFFHKNNDFIFIELPKYKVALLYFCKRSFISEFEAKDSAMEVINAHY